MMVAVATYILASFVYRGLYTRYLNDRAVRPDES